MIGLYVRVAAFFSLLLTNNFFKCLFKLSEACLRHSESFLLMSWLLSKFRIMPFSHFWERVVIFAIVCVFNQED